MGVKGMSVGETWIFGIVDVGLIVLSHCANSVAKKGN